MSKAPSDNALSNVLSRSSTMNYNAIFNGFEKKGIAAYEVKPRENVFTFKAWKELGRVVKKGEHGVSVLTWVAMSKKVEGEKDAKFARPRKTTVFHISQTIEIEGVE